tara:strand:- start:2598 stop:3158 length:561 start_codon:yes stop_codon:yes gene_type:complete
MALQRRRVIPKKRTPAQQAALKKTTSKMPPASKGRLDTRPNSQKMSVTSVSPRKGANQKVNPVNNTVTTRPTPRRRIIPKTRNPNTNSPVNRSRIIPPPPTRGPVGSSPQIQYDRNMQPIGRAADQAIAQYEYENQMRKGIEPIPSGYNFANPRLNPSYRPPQTNVLSPQIQSMLQRLLGSYRNRP